MTEENPMPHSINLPTRENKINWNTAISLGGFVLLVGINLVSFGEFRAQVYESNRNIQSLKENVEGWRVSHMDHHKDRQVEVQSQFARIDQRIERIEENVDQLGTLTHRITVVEQSTQTLGRNIADLNAAISVMSGDIRVIREGVSRLQGGTPQER